MKVIAWNVSDLRKRGVGGQLGVGDYSFLLHAQKCKKNCVLWIHSNALQIENKKKNMFF